MYKYMKSKAIVNIIAKNDTRTPENIGLISRGLGLIFLVAFLLKIIKNY